MITLLLPWPPSLNTLYPTGKNGRRFLSKKGKAYHQAVAAAVIAQRGHQLNRYRGANLAYELTLCPPDKRVRDVSNHLKAIEDCMTQCRVWVDDSCVRKLTAIKADPVKGGHAELIIWDMDCECGP